MKIQVYILKEDEPELNLALSRWFTAHKVIPAIGWTFLMYEPIEDELCVKSVRVDPENDQVSVYCSKI